jgi:sugar lactone lactonase YvrE
MSIKTKFILPLALVLSLALPTVTFAASETGWTKSPNLYEIRTWAGKSDVGSNNGTLAEATFYHPRSVVALSDGKLLVSDSSNHNLRIVTVDRVAGYAGVYLGEDEASLPIGGLNDDVLAKAAFNLPSGLTADSQGNVYVADTGNSVIRRISEDGRVTTVAGSGFVGAEDGVSESASFFEPSDVAVDSKGNVYVADTLNHVIRKVTASGVVSTLNAASARIVEYHPGAVEYVGDYADGVIASAKFNEPSGLAIDAEGNLYVSDRGNQRIRYIDFTTGTVSTVAGGGNYGEQGIYVEGDYVDGAAGASRLNAPEGLAIAPDGSLIVADSLNHVIRLIKDGQVTTLAGVPTEFGVTNGVTGFAQFNHPTDVSVLADGRLVIVDEYGNKVRVLQKYATPASLPTDKGIIVLHNGKLVPSDVPSQLIAGSVLLPLRSVGDALGYKVDYDKTTGAALLTKGDIVYTIGTNTKSVTKSVNGQQEIVALNAPTFEASGRMFLPVRFFAEESGLDIQWDSAAKIVVIRSQTF